MVAIMNENELGVPNPNFFSSEHFENLVRTKIEEDGILLNDNIINLINSVVAKFILDGKTDKQIYIQLKFMGRNLSFGAVESIRYHLKRQI